MTLCILIGGLGFGDEGKGSAADDLTREYGAKLVVRHSGGAQAAHNVVTPDGRHHTFSQFGSGTFAGAHTYLSEYMLVNPLFMLNEARHLEQVGVVNPLSLVKVSRDALVTTPFHVAANRIRESARGAGRHGSCGMGIGETMADSLSRDDSIRVRDLLDPTTLYEKLRATQQRKAAETKDLVGTSETAKRERLLLWDVGFVRGLVERYSFFTRSVQIVGPEYLANELRGDGTIIFEGAQGVLLDQDWGFHPHTTWTDVTYGNAEKLLAGSGCDVLKLGIMRSYMTRHGAGPFVTEDKECDILSTHDHNRTGEWQGNFRSGWLDLVALRYAADVLQPDGLMVTHMDRIASDTQGGMVKPEPGSRHTMCTMYGADSKRMPPGLFEHSGDFVTRIIPKWEGHGRQEQITNALREMQPIYQDFDTKDSLDIIAQGIGRPVHYTSSGPKAEHKSRLVY